MARTTPKATDEVAHWLRELADAKKREAEYRRHGEEILQIYDGRNTGIPFNILYSNTETLLPALYSAIPRPVVQRRFKDDDPLGKAVAEAGTRMLTFQLDTNLAGTPSFDTALRAAVVHALLPGRGETVVKYDAEITGMDERSEDEDAAPATDAPAPTVSGEYVCIETKPWNRVSYGYAKTWEKVPWIAYEDYLDRAEATRLFGAATVRRMRFQAEAEGEGEPERGRVAEDRHQGERKTACIYQIWDKAGGQRVRYLSPQAPDGLLKDDDDPLQLSGFFPCPKPLTFFEKPYSLQPTALYTLYENQAKELNLIQLRINRLIDAMKARGLYDESLGLDLEKLFQAEDVTLVPAQATSSLAAEKGLDNAIWFMPLETMQQALVQLYQAREACKQVIYEITGVSDILRGASAASETATAQTIKNQWGTLRLKRLQKEVARYARDLLRLLLEVAATKFSEETWAQMTGLPFLVTEKYTELTALHTSLQQAMQQQPPPPPGQPPSPLVAQLQQIEQQLQAPRWTQVLGVLRDDQARAYRVDIETNSTVEPEAAEDQKNIADLMTALGQYLNGVAPLVAKGVMPFGVAQSMMLAIARRFRFGSEIEDYIKQMQAPPPEQDGKANEAAMKQQLAQMQQMMEQKQQLKVAQDELALQQKVMAEEKVLLEKKVDLELREIQFTAEQEKFQLEKQATQQMLTVTAQANQQKTQNEQKVATLQNSKFKTENVVNQKADAALGKGVQEMKALVQQLVQTVAQQSKEHQQMVTALTKAMTAPRRKKAIRNKEGRIEAMEDEVMPA